MADRSRARQLKSRKSKVESTKSQSGTTAWQAKNLQYVWIPWRVPQSLRHFAEVAAPGPGEYGGQTEKEQEEVKDQSE